MVTKDVIIRLATREDMPQVMQMIRDLAAYENIPDGPKITEEDLIRDGFGEGEPWFFVLLAEVKSNNRLVGYAICHYAFSSWLGRSMYIEDFYVDPNFRGEKLGHKIFKEICKMACERSVQQIDWHVLKSNTVAINFYQRHGAYDLVEKEGRTAYRMKRDQIRTIAESS